MIGAVLGDLIGSRFEFLTTKQRDVELFHPACTFTDDTICNAAIAAATFVVKENMVLQENLKNKYSHEQSYKEEIEGKQNLFFSQIYTKTLKQITKKYPLAGYGQMFAQWIGSENPLPYNSLGNGALMRVSSIVLISKSLEEAHYFSSLATSITHNHPEALQSVKNYIELLWICKIWNSSVSDLKKILKQKILSMNLNVLTVEEYHQMSGFFVLAPDTLVRSLAAFLEADSFDETMRNVLYIGSDTDTTAAIAGPFAEMVYGVPFNDIQKLLKFFNYSNIELLQYITKSYISVEEKDIGTLFQSNAFYHLYQDWYKSTSKLLLEDPTAAWDPLEEVTEDEYYSETDKILRNEHDTFFGKLLRKLKLKK